MFETNAADLLFPYYMTSASKRFETNAADLLFSYYMTSASKQFLKNEQQKMFNHLYSVGFKPRALKNVEATAAATALADQKLKGQG